MIRPPLYTIDFEIEEEDPYSLYLYTKFDVVNNKQCFILDKDYLILRFQSFNNVYVPFVYKRRSFTTWPIEDRYVCDANKFYNLIPLSNYKEVVL